MKHLILLTLLLSISFSLYAEEEKQTHSTWINRVEGLAEYMAGFIGYMATDKARDKIFLHYVTQESHFRSAGLIETYFQSKEGVKVLEGQMKAAERSYKSAKSSAKANGIEGKRKLIQMKGILDVARARYNAESQVLRESKHALAQLGKTYHKEGRIQLPRKLKWTSNFFVFLGLYGVLTMIEGNIYAMQDKEMETYIGGGYELVTDALSTELGEQIKEELANLFEGALAEE